MQSYTIVILLFMVRLMYKLSYFFRCGVSYDKEKWCLIGAAVLGLGVAGVTTTINPIAQQYVAPMVQEQLHKTVRGTIQYESMHIAWNGDVELQNVTVRDEQNQFGRNRSNNGSVFEMDINTIYSTRVFSGIRYRVHNYYGTT